MRTLIILLLLFSLGKELHAQKETPESRETAAAFEKNYNEDQFREIFLMFSPEMKQALPEAKTIEFLSGLKSQAGNIVSREFLKYVNGSYASYKTKFERGTFLLNISVDGQSRINGLFIKPYQEPTLPEMTRNRTKMILPFRGEWSVFWGGDSKEENYHVENEAQKHAFDFVIRDESGKSYKGGGNRNEDYYAFAEEIIAPCDGEVIQVVDGIKDNAPGEMNPMYAPGNMVILKTKNNEYLVFAHLKQHSTAVKVGQQLRQGALIGLCGNSGNTSEPHLHFHIQNSDDLNHATGVKCYFDRIYVNGELKEDYSPVRSEKIKNAGELPGK